MSKYRWVALSLASAVMAVLFVQLFGATLFSFGPFRVVAEAQLARRGVTSLRVPPFGEVEARTHQTPVRLQVQLDGLDLDTLSDYVQSPSPQTMVVDDAKAAVRPLVMRFTFKALLLGALGGLVVPLLAGRRAGRPLVGGAVVGLSSVALLLGLTVGGYSREAFRHPSYRGVLEAAPWMVGFIERSWDQVDRFGDELETLAANLSSLSSRVEEFGPLGNPNGGLRILHVSDIHNNPAGVKFIREVVTAFDVDAVVDTGDLTDFGTGAEAKFIEGLEGLGVPYYWIPGNHDSPELVRLIRRKSPIRVVDGQPRQFRGLTIAGLADPAAKTASPVVEDETEVAAYSQRLTEMIEGLRRVPDIVAVHNPRMGEALLGRVPLLLAGHTHSLQVVDRRGTTYVNAGTTGAAGVRGLQTQREVPYTVALLHFAAPKEASGEPSYRLEAVDTITVSSRSAGFALERILVGPKGLSVLGAE